MTKSFAHILIELPFFFFFFFGAAFLLLTFKKSKVVDFFPVKVYSIGEWLSDFDLIGLPPIFI